MGGIEGDKKKEPRLLSLSLSVRVCMCCSFFFAHLLTRLKKERERETPQVGNGGKRRVWMDGGI